MSLQDYLKTKELMGQYSSEIFDKLEPRSETLLQLAESALGLQFSPIYRQFVLEYGAIGFGSFDIYGVINNDFENSEVPDAVWYTLRQRKLVDMPNYLIIIYSVGNGELFCLDCSKRNEQGEAPVISYWPSYPLNVQTWEVIAQDFGEFLLKRVEEEIEYIKEDQIENN